MATHPIDHPSPRCVSANPTAAQRLHALGSKVVAACLMNDRPLMRYERLKADMPLSTKFDSLRIPIIARSHSDLMARSVPI